MHPSKAALNSAAALLRSTGADAIGVSLSFGKDSLATLELCCALFERVEAFYLYRVRDLDFVSAWSEAVARRWGVRVRLYPHFDLSRIYRHSVLQPHWPQTRAAARLSMAEIEDCFRQDARVDWIAYGWRRSDSPARAAILKALRGLDVKRRRVFPLRSWTRRDVVAFLERRRIPLPPSLGRSEQGGLDFHPEALRYLREHWPADYERYLRDFPFACWIADHWPEDPTGIQETQAEVAAVGNGGRKEPAPPDPPVP